MARRLRWFVWPLLLLGLVLPVTAADVIDTLPPLGISIDARNVTVTGGQPNGKILIIGYERTGGKYSVGYRRHRAYLFADAAGNVSLTPRKGIAPESTWVAVDLQSGRYGAIAPGSLPLRRKPLPANALKHEPNGQVRKLVASLPSTYLVVVRPGEGAWELSAGDGGLHDRDNAVDGKTEMSADDFQAVEDSGPPPRNFRKDDLLLLFSPEQASFFVLRMES